MSMTLVQYRKEVRRILRDDSYPQQDIDAAINRVLLDVNEMGRFKFHEASYTLNLTANTYIYAIPANVQAEKIFIYDLGGNNQVEVPRRREIWTGVPMVPDANNSNDYADKPAEWSRYANNWYIYPIPNATAAGNDITVLYDKDLLPLFSPMDTSALPDRHQNVLIYGAVSQLRPGLLIGSPEGQVAIETLFARAVRNMMQTDLWQSAFIPSLRVGPRFRNMSQWGFVGKIR